MTPRRIKIELTLKEAEMVNEGLAMLDAEIEQNELDLPRSQGGRGQRELGAIATARQKLFNAGYRSAD